MGSTVVRAPTPTQPDENTDYQRAHDADQRPIMGKIIRYGDEIDQLPFGPAEMGGSLFLEVVREIARLAADFTGMAGGGAAKVVDRIRGGLLQARDVPLRGGKERS